MENVSELVKSFLNKYKGTIVWRYKKHSNVIEGYINPNEKVLYAFAAQNNNDWYDIFSSCVVVLTNKRILIGQKRLMWGSIYTQITPDMYNDMEVYQGLFFGKIIIDTVKEKVVLSNISKKALDEIETNISEFMMNEKKNNYENKSKD